ncbi:MAG: holo-ACP synthase [Kistimonas sp.]|nr:holo-ACP synthase [Kistimonas sp.]
MGGCSSLANKNPDTKKLVRFQQAASAGFSALSKNDSTFQVITRMIAGIGVDIISVSRMESVFERRGDRLALRLLTAEEYAVFKRRKRPVHYLATRFAAKEAAAKALGTGIGAVSFQDIAVLNLSSGAPVLLFSGRAQHLQQVRHITKTHISLSDEEAYAQAFVILETTQPC